jgi:hypothetical protein
MLDGEESIPGAGVNGGDTVGGNPPRVSPAARRLRTLLVAAPSLPPLIPTLATPPTRAPAPGVLSLGSQSKICLLVLGSKQRTPWRVLGRGGNARCGHL